MSSYKNVYKHIAVCIIQVLFKKAELPEGDRDRAAGIDIQVDRWFISEIWSYTVVGAD